MRNWCIVINLYLQRFKHGAGATDTLITNEISKYKNIQIYFVLLHFWTEWKHCIKYSSNRTAPKCWMNTKGSFSSLWTSPTPGGRALELHSTKVAEVGLCLALRSQRVLGSRMPIGQRRIPFRTARWAVGLGPGTARRYRVSGCGCVTWSLKLQVPLPTPPATPPGIGSQ